MNKFTSIFMDDQNLDEILVNSQNKIWYVLHLNISVPTLCDGWMKFGNDRGEQAVSYT
jgi:hypothetical protein